MNLRQMDLRIYEILGTRNVISLRNFLEENELIFDRFLTDFVSQIPPLHIAIQHRSVDFAREILRRKPQLAYVLSSQGFSPLRMASANGSVEIVRVLLPLIVDVSHDRDSKGWTPVHAAAMKGHVHVLEEFNGTNPEWIRDITDRDETVLHLCVKYNKLDALRMLIGSVGRDNELVNQKDENGNTILHLAAMKKDMEMITYLVSPETGLEINAVNMNGFTALDFFAPYPSTSADTNMVKKLQENGAEGSQEAKATSELKNVLMLVGTLTATLCFQAAIVPPGGLWQDDSNMSNNTLDQKNHTAGTSILADKDPNMFRQFQIFNQIVFLLSLILILVGGTVVGPISDVGDSLRRISDVVNIPSFLRPLLSDVGDSPFLRRISDVVDIFRRILSDFVSLPSILPFQLCLPIVLSFVSVMIYDCNKVHTPKGLPHDTRSSLNAWNITFLVLSSYICFGFCMRYMDSVESLKKRLKVARNRGSDVDTGNQQLFSNDDRDPESSSVSQTRIRRPEYSLVSQTDT